MSGIADERGEEGDGHVHAQEKCRHAAERDLHAHRGCAADEETQGEAFGQFGFGQRPEFVPEKSFAEDAMEPAAAQMAAARGRCGKVVVARVWESACRSESGRDKERERAVGRKATKSGEREQR